MSNQTAITGRAVADPELRFGASGTPWATFTVADSYKPKTGEPKNTFIDVKMFNEMAEYVADSIQKGDRVLVIGKIQQENWVDKETGGKRSKLVLIADEVGPSLRFNTAQLDRTYREKPES